MRIVLAADEPGAGVAIDVTDATGQPVAGAAVAVSARVEGMAPMDGHDASAPSVPVAPGRYETGPMPLPFPGRWRVMVRVSPRGAASRPAGWRVVAAAP